ncbi:CDP-alcohol phosphatidyltransferase family protein [Wenzhouxiangella sp. XN79A]|uniref:CDP-alcohol phosphatidyltransferase family protein n=1 Tax=Wenzhouxiangella sp. XN79A TaxID=2724193 RepID=UPI00144AE854|nr:CDP-alcohol phosphatidyltransferase family protein [Wenzhouxiangella sp. XN79A]NKI33974.1 CDP-alcohol phosphatidyltransferase family protein [Wenzhouxiangella sp. XN79A]
MPIAERIRPILPDLAAGAGLAMVVQAALPLSLRVGALAMLATVAVYAGVAAAIGRAWPAHRREFGWPNRVTLARAALVAVLAGLLVAPAAIAEHGQMLAALAALALLLDGLDGWLARITGRVSAFGARFDMEIDALLILVLSLALALTGKVGPWVLAIGLMRYAFVLAGRAWPKLTAELRPGRTRKVICVLQGVVLAACLVPAVPAGWATALASLSLLALTASFIFDTTELARRPDPAGEPR